MKRAYKPLLLAALLLCLGIAVAVLPVRDTLAAAVSFIESHRTISWALFVGLYVVAAVALIPGSILTLGAGFVFGLPLGLALVSVGSTAGAAAAFLIGRFLARDWVAARIGGLRRFRALDRASRSDGFVIVLLTRLSPIFPYNLINYAFGLTGVRFRDYLGASWLGMLPATAVYVYLGTLTAGVADVAAGETERGWLSTALLAAGFAATIALTVVITRRATRSLSSHLDDESVEQP